MAALADTFTEIVGSLASDWTDLELDLRIADEARYIDAASLISQVNAMPYNRDDWHWRVNVAHRFGHAAAPSTVRGTFALLDAQGIEGEMRVRSVRQGRAEVEPTWDRPESVLEDFRQRRQY
ncbi:MAG: hypothetical protein ACR2NA_08745 [Solirubrobacterales bacterium]